jgi:molybdopterin adenylyltransferase
VNVHIITVSDRASAGVYADRSGPHIRSAFEAFGHERDMPLQFSAETVPDEADLLRTALLTACTRGADVIVTTGGTGVGPRDVTPEVVLAIADKTLPGIMEYIRVTYGATNPRALLSRSVAAVRGRTIIYTLPGSPRAVDEYLFEIFKTLEHTLGLIRGEQVH